MRLTLEAKYSKEQYNDELNKRINDLTKKSLLVSNTSELTPELQLDKIKASMEKEGWSNVLDNRYNARKKRLESACIS